MQNHWNERYLESKQFFGSLPNQFMTKQVERLKLLDFSGHRRALSLGEGEGKDALWLAQKGFSVRAVDSSQIAIDRIHALAVSSQVKITAQLADLVDYVPRSAYYDLIILLFCHLPEKLRAEIHLRASRALRPGGVLLLEAFSPKQRHKGLTSGGPKDLSMLYTCDLLDKDFAGMLEILHLEECTENLNYGRHSGVAELVRMVARARFPVKVSETASVPHR